MRDEPVVLGSGASAPEMVLGAIFVALAMVRLAAPKVALFAGIAWLLP